MSDITIPALPADLPEDFKMQDIIAPNGADVGKSPQHGYNYLMQQMNETQRAVMKMAEDANSAFENKANENILRNSNFAINQRGQATYGAGNYTVDGFRLSVGTVTVLPNGVRLSADAEDLYQTFLTAEDKRIHDGIYTASAKIDEKIHSYTTTLDFSSKDRLVGGFLGTSGVYANIICNWGVMGKFLVGISSKGTERFVEWLQLEEGNTATRYVPPNPADELARCQRFFEVMEEPMLCSKEWVGKYFAPHNGSFKQTKRAIPTITFENNVLQYYGESQTQPPATVVAQTVTKSAIVSIASSVAQPNDSVYGQGYAIRGKIFADAEVY